VSLCILAFAKHSLAQEGSAKSTAEPKPARVRFERIVRDIERWRVHVEPALLDGEHRGEGAHQRMRAREDGAWCRPGPTRLTASTHIPPNIPLAKNGMMEQVTSRLKRQISTEPSSPELCNSVKPSDGREGVSQNCAAAMPQALSLGDFSGLDLIVPQLEGADSGAAIRELSAALERAGYISDSAGFSQIVLKREALASTASEQELAFPHGRLRGLARPVFAFGRAPAPILWSGAVNARVRLVFLLAASESDAQIYLQLISGLARISRSSEISTQLLQAIGVDEIMEVLRRVPLRGGAAVARPPQMASIGRQS